MATAIHVNGVCVVQTGTGADEALETLGVTVDGADVEIIDQTYPVHVDTYGGTAGVPFDEQTMLQMARIRVDLVHYDETVLAKLRPCLPNGVDGTMPAAGALFGVGGSYRRLLLTSPIAGLPWNFLKARVDGSRQVRLGTKHNIWRMSFLALPYSGSTVTSSGVVLYNRTSN